MKAQTGAGASVSVPAQAGIMGGGVPGGQPVPAPASPISAEANAQ
jgi:hypothetical protein